MGRLFRDNLGASVRLAAQERWDFDALLVSIWLLLRLRTAHLWLDTRRRSRAWRLLWRSRLWSSWLLRLLMTRHTVDQ